MKNLLPLLGIAFLLSSCCHKITPVSEETSITEVEHVIPSPPVIVKESVSTSLSSEIVKAAISKGTALHQEKKTGGLITVLRIDSSGNVYCEATIDSLVRLADSLRIKVPYKTITKTNTITRATDLDKAIRYIFFGIILCFAGWFIFAQVRR